MHKDLLPGERVEVRLRPTPWAAIGAYARASAFALYGLLLWFTFTAGWWRGHEAGAWYRFWEHLYGNTAAAHVYTALGLVGGAVLFGLAMRRRWWEGAAFGAVVSGAVVGTSLLLEPQAYSRSLPVLLGIASAVALTVVETDRRMRAILFTNIACVARPGIWRRAAGRIRYEDIADIDVHQGPMGLALGFGDLVPVLRKHAEDAPAPVIRGVRPIAAGRELLAAMAQQATSTPQLQRANRTEERMHEAVRRLRAKRV